VEWRDTTGEIRMRTTADQERAESDVQYLHAVAREWRERRHGSAQPGDPLIFSAVYDGTADWWDKLNGHIATRILACAADGDREGVELWSKAGRAVAALANSAASQRDLRKLEQLIERLEARDKELSEAAERGNRARLAQAS